MAQMRKLGVVMLARVGVCALVLVSCVVAAHADANSQKRLKAFAALPDWSGLWGPSFGPFGMGKKGQPTVGPQATANDDERKKLEAATHFHPDFKPEWEARYQAEIQKVLKIDGQKACNGFGFPENMISPSAFQIIVEPEETTIISSMGDDTRHIHTDGRSHPASADLWPTQNGNSVGRWVGQTLMVDTVDANALMIIAPFIAGHRAPSVYLSDMFSEQAHITERIQMTGKDELQDEITLEDPVALEQPWRFTQTYRRQTDIDQLIVENCFGNDRNPLEDGKYTISPAP